MAGVARERRQDDKLTAAIPLFENEMTVDVCATNLSAFSRHAWPHVDPSPFVDGWHARLMCDYLQAVSDGDIERLVINVPPGHQKSLTVCVFWPVWVWIEKPEKRFMFTSYRGDLALRDADRSRQLIRSEWYQRSFGSSFTMRPDQDTKSRYMNNRGGYRFSTSVAGIMGEGGDFVILDDPHNVEQAESDEVRDETVRKIRLALPSRVRAKRGGVVVIMQRLHERDLVGALLADEPDKWVHLCLPARYTDDHPFKREPLELESGRKLNGDRRTENGEKLLPELFDEERLTTLEEQLGAYGTAGQLDQLPAPRDGALFKREWFDGKVVKAAEVPHGGTVARGYDFASSEKQTAKYSAGSKMRRVDKRFYIEHVWRERVSSYELKRAMRRLAEGDGHDCVIDIPRDPGQSGEYQRSDIVQEFDDFTIRSSPETGSKVARADGLAGQAEAGNVYLVEGAWNRDYLNELCAFPRGTFSDQVDASSRAYHRVRKPRSGPVGAAPEVIEG